MTGHWTGTAVGWCPVLAWPSAWADALPGSDRLVIAERQGAQAQAQAASARLLLRRMLAGHLGPQAWQVPLAHTPLGKPYLADYPGFHISLSHGGGVVAAALSGAGPVGVDVDDCDNMPPPSQQLAFARRFFPAAEAQFLADTPPDDRTGAFLTLWTAKEAVGKALGQGVAQAIGQVEVNCAQLALNDQSYMAGIRGHAKVPAIKGWRIEHNLTLALAVQVDNLERNLAILAKAVLCR